MYDVEQRHFHVNSLTGAMARQYVCRGCNKGCESGATYKWGDTCSDYRSVPPFIYSERMSPVRVL